LTACWLGRLLTLSAISRRWRRAASWQFDHAAPRTCIRKSLTRTRLLEQVEQLKARVRAKVEHPFHAVKNLLRNSNVRYKGKAKIQSQLYSLFSLANLVLAKRSLMGMQARGTP
jgi:hypothetical protein